MFLLNYITSIAYFSTNNETIEINLTLATLLERDTGISGCPLTRLHFYFARNKTLTTLA